MKELETHLVEEDTNGEPTEVFHKSFNPVLGTDNKELLEKLKKAKNQDEN